MNNFLLKTLKLGWVAFHSVTFQLKCLDFQSNQYKKLVPVLSRFCNGLLELHKGVWVFYKMAEHSFPDPGRFSKMAAKLFQNTASNKAF